jgi:hypothetical protein
MNWVPVMGTRDEDLPQRVDALAAMDPGDRLMYFLRALSVQVQSNTRVLQSLGNRQQRQDFTLVNVLDQVGKILNGPIGKLAVKFGEKAIDYAFKESKVVVEHKPSAEELLVAKKAALQVEAMALENELKAAEVKHAKDKLITFV